MLTIREIVKATGVQYYVVDYLVKTGKIEATGGIKGVPRQFPPDTIEKINEILAIRDGRACRIV